jgi:hypothetical protein
MGDIVDDIDVPLVTPEMIQAGVDELFRHPIVQPEERAMAVLVERVYCAMEIKRLRADGFP